jgi:uncharacterized Fe-S cluster-containing MiaB family protein
MPDTVVYPATSSARDRFVVERRGSRPLHDAWRHQGVIVEDERAVDGSIARTATVLITGRECPWRCAMCDLWRYTTADDTPVGAVAAQVASARQMLSAQDATVTCMKLYNAGSFFDRRAVPEEDFDSVAASLGDLSRVVVESHPAFILRTPIRLDRFLKALDRHRGEQH